jgi:hypothetical protein
MPLESVTQSLCDLALRFGEDSDEGGGLVREEDWFRGRDQGRRVRAHAHATPCGIHAGGGLSLSTGTALRCWPISSLAPAESPIWSGAADRRLGRQRPSTVSGPQPDRGGSGKGHSLLQHACDSRPPPKRAFPCHVHVFTGTMPSPQAHTRGTRPRRLAAGAKARSPRCRSSSGRI